MMVSYPKPGASKPPIKDPLKREFLDEFLEQLKQEYHRDLVAAALVGSVARGEDDKESDLDLILILDTQETISQRASRIGKMLAKLNKKWMSSKDLSWYPRLDAHLLSLDEALVFRPIYLELYADGIILEDSRGVLARILRNLEIALRKHGSIRIQLPNGDRVWMLDPKLEMGDELRIGIQ